MIHSPLSVTPERLRVLPAHRPHYIDCYDRAVAILTRRPDLIERSWAIPKKGSNDIDKMFGRKHSGPPNLRFLREKRLTDYCHCLFGFANTTQTGDGGQTIAECHGCLTQIRGSTLRIAETPSLTKAIRSDSRLPMDGYDITVGHLPLFAGWHRNRIDPALNRTPLPMRVGG